MAAKSMGSQPVTIEGIFQGFLGVHAFGWANVANTDWGAVKLVVHVDGCEVADGVANLPSPELGEGVKSQAAFRIPLPASFFDGKEREVKVFIKNNNSNISLPISPQFLGTKHFDGFLTRVTGKAVQGWCCPRALQAEPCLVDLYIDGVFQKQARASQPRPDLISYGIQAMHSGFDIPLPKFCADGFAHSIDVRCNGRSLLGAPQIYQAVYEGFIDTLTHTGISGWIINKSAPGVPVQLDLKVDGLVFEVTANLKRQDLEYRFGSIHHGFSFDFPKFLSNRDFMDAYLSVHGTDLPILGKSLLLCTEAGFKSLTAHAVYGIQSHMRSMATNTGVTASALPPVLEQISALIQTGHSSGLPAPAPSLRAALRGERPSAPCMLVVVEEMAAADFSPDALLASLTEEHGRLDTVVVFTNPGGPRSVHLRHRLEAIGIPGLSEAGFLARCADATSGAGEDQPKDLLIVSGCHVPPLAVIRAWHHELVSVPALTSVSPVAWSDATAVALQQVPVLSRPDGDGRATAAPPASNTGQPETAFLVRPRADMMFLKGVRISAADLPEDGSLAGFLGRWIEGQTRAGGLHALTDAVCMPASKALQCDDFLSSKDHDLYLSMANRLAERRLIQDERPTILHVLHNLGGGILVHCQDLAAMTGKAGVRSLFLRPLDGKRLLLLDPSNGVGRLFRSDDDLDELVMMARRLKVRCVHLHHVLGQSDLVWALPERLGVPLDVTIHDYYWICPRVTLMDESGRYCGEPSLSACDKCVSFAGVYPGQASRYDELGGTVAAWRRYHRVRLESARTVFVPSIDVLKRMTAYFPDVNVQPLPHAERLPSVIHTRKTARTGRIGVAVIGGIGVHKGFDELVGLARWADKRHLPLHFHVIGAVPDLRRISGLGNLSLTGQYDREQLPDLLATADCQLALFLSVWPETYCYTLSEALAAGLTPVGYDLGAIGDRIRASGHGVTVPFASPPEAIANALMDAYAWRSSLNTPVSIDIGVSEGDYLDAYLRFLAIPTVSSEQDGSR